MWDLLNSYAHLGPEICSKLIPLSESRDFSRALICGVSLENSERQIFIDTGLIHIMVVSGAHLHFFERLVPFFPRRIRTFLLALYCWLTGFGAPIVRSFVRRLIEPRLRARAWSTLQIEAATAALVLSAIPVWFTSRSFLMSWMCALALAFPWMPSRSGWVQSTVVFLFLYLFCSSSPFTIAFNALLAPAIGALFFPLSLATVFAPALTAVSDFCWHQLLEILKMGPDAPAASEMIRTRTLMWIPWIVQFVLIFMEIRWRRRVFFLSR